MTELHIGMVGYGEVGKIFTAGLLPQVARVSAWDLTFDLPERQAAERAHAARAGVQAPESSTPTASKARNPSVRTPPTMVSQSVPSKGGVQSVGVRSAR